MDTDARNVSLAAVLSNVIDRDERPHEFASRVLSKTESIYSTAKKRSLGGSAGPEVVQSTHTDPNIQFAMAVLAECRQPDISDATYTP